MDLTLLLIGLLVLVAVASLILVVGLRPMTAIPVLVVGLPIQTLVLSLLTAAGAGTALVNGAASWKELCVLTAVGALLVTRPVPGPLRLPDKIAIAYGAFTTAAGAVSVGVGAASPQAVLFGYRQAMVPVLLYALGRLLPIDREGVMRLVRIALVVASVVAVVAIVERVIVADGFWESSGWSKYAGLSGGDSDGYAVPFEYFYTSATGNSTRRAVAPYGSPLNLAYSLIFPLALCIVLLSRRQHWLNARLVGLAGALVGTAIALSITRAVIIGGILGGFAGLLLLRRRGALVSYAVVVGAVMFVLLSQVTTILSETTSLSDPSARVHAQSLQQGVQIVTTHPLGVGLGQGGFVGRTLGNSAAGGESLYVVLAGQGGLAALVLFLSLVGVVMRESLSVARASPDTSDAFFAEAVLIATIAFLLASVTTEHWLAFLSAGVMWLATGIVVSRAHALRLPP